MTQLLEVVRSLTEGERQEVQDFAEFLLARRAKVNVTKVTGNEGYLDVDALSAIFSKLPMDRSSLELSHEATELRATKHMK